MPPDIVKLQTQNIKLKKKSTFEKSTGETFFQ